MLKCWKRGVEGHRERDCQVVKAEGTRGGWSGGQYGMRKNGGSEQEESVMFGGEREKEEWEQEKIEAILDTGCWGNLCGLK